MSWGRSPQSILSLGTTLLTENSLVLNAGGAHKESDPEVSSLDSDSNSEIKKKSKKKKMSQSTHEETENPPIPNKRTSIAWQYFIETSDPNMLQCNKCKKTCSYKRKSTGNLVRHIRLRHKVDWAAYVQGIHPTLLRSQDASQVDSQSVSHEETYYAINEIRQEVDNNPENEDPTMDTHCENTPEIPKPSVVVEEQNIQEQNLQAYYLVQPIDVTDSKKIDDQFFKLFVKEFYPFNLAEDPEFVSFVHMLNFNYMLPQNKSLSELLQKTYEVKVEQLKSTLTKIKHIALTIDRWKTINDENFIAVSAYYLDNDLTHQSSLLDCISFHDSINIPIFLQELVGKWRISDKIVAVVTDDDPAIIEAIKECQWQHISCFAHALNRIITTSLESINDVLNKIRKVVDHFKNTPNGMAELESYQNEFDMANVKLKKDAPNRWNSTFDMITRFFKNKDILKAGLIKDLPEELSADDWLKLENTVKLLVVFNTITIEICSEKVVSLSKVPYMIKFMMKHVNNVIENIPLSSEIENMGKKLKEKLLEQSGLIETSDIISQSVLLDPRMKKRGFQESCFNVAYSSLLQDVILLKNKKMHETWIARSGNQGSTNNEYFIDIWSDFREKKKPPEKDFTPDATAEIDAYLSEAYLSMKDNPTSYWGKEINQKKFPILYELVKSRLCVPASCVPCNNIFSKKENTITERRNFLSSKEWREILFLHHNFNAE